MNEKSGMISAKTEALLRQAKKSILFVIHRPDIVMERGEGAYLWDTEGKRYLDFIGGWAVNCLGHSPAVIARALEEQAGRLVNASPAFYNDKMIELAGLLCDCSCFDKVFFASSGAEANEGAVKLARKYGAKHLNGAYEIITAINSFHGRTLAMMSASGKKAWAGLFAPKVEGFVHVPFNDVESVRSAVTPKTCAVMLEPVQGEGGVFPADEKYIREVRELCDERRILLIFDEIQTGIGRTGALFAYEHYGIEPDIMTLGKGIGGGFPLSAMMTKEKFDIFDPGDQGGTYTGQPLAMAVGYAVVREVIDKKLGENAARQGEYILLRLKEIGERFKLKDIRGRGLLIAFDLPEEKGADVVQESLKEGLLINSPQPSTIRLMPPLIISREHADEMLRLLEKVLAAVIGG